MDDCCVRHEAEVRNPQQVHSLLRQCVFRQLDVYPHIRRITVLLLPNVFLFDNHVCVSDCPHSFYTLNASSVLSMCTQIEDAAA